MSKITREEIVQLWTSVTDFGESWTEKIREIQERIDELKKVEDYDVIRDDLEDLMDAVVELNDEIERVVKDAIDGVITMEELSELFNEFADQLLSLEQELIELELEPEEFDEEEGWEEGEEEEEY